MAEPVLVVRVAANISELRKNLLEGTSTIETTKAAMTSMANAFDGSKIIAQSGAVMAQIEKIGGVTNLTAAEQSKANRILEEALAKYDALGREAPPGMQKIADATRGAEQQTSIFAGSFGRLVAAFSAASLIDRAVSSLIGLGKEAYQSATQVADLASKTGLSTDTIQRMAFVAESTGSSVGTFTQASFKLGAALAGGSASVVGAVEKLGLSFEALRVMSPDQQFETIMAALGEMTSEGERARLGMILFGRSFSEMAAATAQGYDGLAAKATLMSQETIAAADRFDDRWVESKTFMKALLAETAAFVYDARLPFLALAEAVGLLSPAVAKARGDIELSSPVFTDWAGRMSDARDVLDKLTPAQLRQIKTAQDLGATTEELKTEFTLTDDAIKLLNGRFSELSEQQKKAKSDADATTAAYEKQEAAYRKLMSDTKNANQLAIMNDAAAAMARQAENANQLRLMERDAWQAQFATFEEGIATTIAAEQALQAEQGSGLTIIGQTTEELQRAGTAADEAGQAGINAFAGVAQQVQITGDGLKEYINLMRYTAQANEILGRNGLYTSQGQREAIAALPAPRANGGPVSAGSSYMVGERGPELFVPERSGSIVPNGAAGGVTLAPTLNFHGPVIGSSGEFEAMVSAALLNVVKMSGSQMPSSVQ